MRVALALMVCLPFVGAYKTGAPTAACVTMTPQHGQTNKKLADSPFNVTVNINVLLPGKKLTVTVNGIKGVQFKGILLQVRANGDSPVGTWTVPDSNYKHLKCSGGQALTHANPNPKPAVSTFEWTAPNVTSPTKHTLYATLVQSAMVVYVKQQPNSSIMVSPMTTSNMTSTMKSMTSPPMMNSNKPMVQMTTSWKNTTVAMTTTSRAPSHGGKLYLLGFSMFLAVAYLVDWL